MANPDPVQISQAGAATKGEIRALMRGPRAIIVGGSFGDYDTVDAALAAVTDAADDKRYDVVLQAGEYAPFTGKNHMNVHGSGRGTIIPCSAAAPINIAGFATVSNMRILYDDAVGGGSGAVGAIQKIGAAINGVVLSDLDIEVLSVKGAAGDRYGINWQANTVNAYLNNVNIITRGCGIYYSSAGNLTVNGSNVFMIGEDDDSETGLNRYGLIIPGPARVTWHGGRITCGYNGYPQSNPRESTKDVVGVLIPQSNVNTSVRADLFGTWVYAHNRATTIAGKLNTTRADNGWIRRYGTTEQAENPNTSPNWDATAAYGAFNTVDDPRFTGPSAGIGGVNQLFGGRASGSSGNVGGQLITLDGVAPASPALDGSDTGVVRLDSTAGPFTAQLSTAQAGVGQDLLFVNDGPNVVTLDAKTNHVIRPFGTQTIELQGWETCRMIRLPDDNWLELSQRPFVRQGGFDATVMTGTDIEVVSHVVPGGYLGDHGAIMVDTLVNRVNLAGTADRMKLAINGNNLAEIQLQQGGGWSRRNFIVVNNGAANAQFGPDVNDYGYGEGTQAISSTINTNNPFTVSLKLNGLADDQIQLAWYRLEILK